MIGWIGLGLLVLGYVIYFWSEVWFLRVNSIGTLLLAIHSYIITDYPLFFTNLFILLVILLKQWSLYKDGIKGHRKDESNIN